MIAKKQPFLAEAAALLFPITWPEPFGLGHDRGDGLRYASNCSLGVTGFIVENEEHASPQCIGWID